MRTLWQTARSPPNAPETVAAEKKIAARIPNSERLYQLEDDEYFQVNDCNIGRVDKIRTRTGSNSLENNL